MLTSLLKCSFVRQALTDWLSAFYIYCRHHEEIQQFGGPADSTGGGNEKCPHLCTEIEMWCHQEYGTDAWKVIVNQDLIMMYSISF